MDSQIDPWKQTLVSLAAVTDRGANFRDVASAAKPRKSGRRKITPRSRSCAESIRILEWQDEETIVVCWCDSTLGHYGEQIWQLRAARGSGLCSLSGCPIKRGDPVFRPRCRGLHHLAYLELEILASKLDCPLPAIATGSGGAGSTISG
ncbi:DUF3331 domain-containing protein [Paraburkholderia sp. GAS199]|uniref:DUF3331 domain-containing protein n=1 Tax=Paraburkholderia sp. GAS199 TaxID=3035126 RepID=UPI003D2064BE